MDAYKKTETEELQPEDPLIKHYKRIYLCLIACEGIDDSMLEILSKKSRSGITNMQHILNKITWTGLPTQQ